MNAVPAQLCAPKRLGVTISLLFTATVLTRIDKVTFSNTNAGPATVGAWLVPQGQSPGIDNIITNTQSIAAAATFNDPNFAWHVMNPGDSMYAGSDIGYVIVMVSGVQFP